MSYYDLKTKPLWNIESGKNCSHCQTPLQLAVELTGGCGGHFDSDDRCYCDSPDVRITAQCPNWKPQWGPGLKNKPKHDEPFILEGMTDQYSLQHTLTKLLLEQT